MFDAKKEKAPIDEHLFLFLDIDECQKDNIHDEDANKCSDDADCINTAGGFQCRCQNGFVGDGFDCLGTHCAFKLCCRHTVHLQ